VKYDQILSSTRWLIRQITSKNAVSDPVHSGSTFAEQAELVDSIAERIQLPGRYQHSHGGRRG
jgi:hypothetical protein